MAGFKVPSSGKRAGRLLRQLLLGLAVLVLAAAAYQSGILRKATVNWESYTQVRLACLPHVTAESGASLWPAQQLNPCTRLPDVCSLL